MWARVVSSAVEEVADVAPAQAPQTHDLTLTPPNETLVQSSLRPFRIQRAPCSCRYHRTPF